MIASNGNCDNKNKKNNTFFPHQSKFKRTQLLFLGNCIKRFKFPGLFQNLMCVYKIPNPFQAWKFPFSNSMTSTVLFFYTV